MFSSGQTENMKIACFNWETGDADTSMVNSLQLLVLQSGMWSLSSYGIKLTATHISFLPSGKQEASTANTFKNWYPLYFLIFDLKLVFFSDELW